MPKVWSDMEVTTLATGVAAAMLLIVVIAMAATRANGRTCHIKSVSSCGSGGGR